LYAYGFRYYDPAIGRFTGVDPIADEFPHLSVYNYASNDPVRNIDLHGLQGVDRSAKYIARDQGNSQEYQEKGKSTGFMEWLRSVLPQGHPDAEDFHDHESADGGYQEFSAGGDRNSEGVAPTATAEEGAEVEIILLEDMFPSGGGSGGMGSDPVEIIDNLVKSFDNAKKAKEKYEEQQNTNEGNDTTERIPFGGDTVYWYRPPEEQ